MLQNNKLFSAGFLLLVGALASCSDTDSVTEEMQVVHWGYGGAVGPENWAALDDDFAVCSMGEEQSPIDIPFSASVNPGNLNFAYSATPVNIVNNGHTVQVNYAEGSNVEIDGEMYNLLQFHFHGPSEHTLAGARTALEMHLVHANASGSLAVVGILIEEGDENGAYSSVFSNIPDETSEAEIIDGEMVNAINLLPSDRSYYRYDGSLTTPPCSEGVKWHLLRNVVTLSATQIAAFSDIIELNNRPVLPMNAREFILVE